MANSAEERRRRLLAAATIVVHMSTGGQQTVAGTLASWSGRSAGQQTVFSLFVRQDALCVLLKSTVHGAETYDVFSRAWLRNQHDGRRIHSADGRRRLWNGRASLSVGGATTAMIDARLRRTESEYSAPTAIMRAGSRHDRISGDAACCADWVLLTVDNSCLLYTSPSPRD